jgi:hypothetical protein
LGCKAHHRWQPHAKQRGAMSKGGEGHWLGMRLQAVVRIRGRLR